jgi:putative nucleotidyltransferase with HDIG domain
MPPVSSLTVDAPGVQEPIPVVVDEQATYRSFLREEVCQNGQIPPTHRYRVLRGITRAVFDAIFHGGRLDDLHGLAKDFGRPLVDIIRDDDLVLSDLIRLMSGKSGIYAHSVHVATYTVILAAKLGMTARGDLEAIATGALLHDIGKRHIQPALLDHPGPLSERQHEIVKQHPIRGFKELFFRKDVRWDQLMLVYQHHERIDGRGYPVGLEGQEIHPWARICAVADIFHALTSDRPYHQPMLFGDAFDYLARESGNLVDKDMVECWTATMSPCFR